MATLHINRSWVDFPDDPEDNATFYEAALLEAANWELGGVIKELKLDDTPHPYVRYRKGALKQGLANSRVEDLARTYQDLIERGAE